MTTFKEQMEADLDVFMDSDEFADTVRFSSGSIDSDVNAIVDHDVVIQAEGYEAGVGTLGTTITAKVADVGSPQRGDTFVFDGTTYTVQRQEENDGVVVTVVVK